jgi:hypothetical protein
MIVRKNVRLSEVVVPDVFHSDHLPIIFHSLDRVRTINRSETVDKSAGRERLQGVASELISPRHYRVAGIATG